MAKEKKTTNQIAAEIVRQPVHEWLPNEYIVYALYTIRDRALLAEDGLKPVNRRILWSMYDSDLGPNSSHKKAQIVASDANNYHPHGDASISDALARMAQNFSLRVPLIEPSGTVGFVTGDKPAAPRYWEARLTKAAMELLQESKEGAVELVPNFDGTKVEPVLLPVRWPNDIINGTQGLAVGFASKIPSHNPTEVMEACIALLHNPELTVDELLKIMPGPDFPTGGEILEIDGIKNYYETGNGRFIIRARYKIEHLTRGRVKIIFHELPYGVSAEQVMTKVSELRTSQEKTVRGKKVSVPANEKLTKGISSVKDLTDMKHGLRLVFETTQGSNHLQVINELFKTTPLQIPFSVNNTVLLDNHPVQSPILDMLRGFIEFRKTCTMQKAEHRLGKIEERLVQLDAMLAVLVDIDKAISIIRKADTSETACVKLQKTFKISKEQAEYILSMQLRRLTKADSLAIKEEKAKLDTEKINEQAVMSDANKLIERVDVDLRSTLKTIGDTRRSKILGLTSEDVKAQAKEVAAANRNGDKNLTCYVTRFANGTLMKSETPFGYEPNSRKLLHTPVVEQIKMKTKDSLVIVSSDGMGHKVPLSFLGTDRAVNAVDLGLELDKSVHIVGMAKVDPMKSDVGLALGTRNGGVKISKCDFPNREEFPVITLDEKDEVVDCRWLGRALTGSYFVFVSKAGNVLVFDAKSVRETGHKAGGVRGMKLKSDDDAVISFGWVDSLKNTENMIVTYSGKTIKRTLLSEIPPKGKGTMGVATQIFKPGEEKLVTAYAGTNVAACVSRATHNTVNLPPVVKRSYRGVDFTMDVILGSYDVFTM